MRKTGTDGLKTFDELPEQGKRMSWVHTVLKGLVYGSVENIVRCASYGTGHRWYKNKSEVRHQMFVELWTAFDDCVDAMATLEKNTSESIMGARAMQLVETCMRILITIFDNDTAWRRRINACLDVLGLTKYRAGTNDKSKLYKQ